MAVLESRVCFTIPVHTFMYVETQLNTTSLKKKTYYIEQTKAWIKVLGFKEMIEGNPLLTTLPRVNLSRDIQITSSDLLMGEGEKM